MRMSRQRRAYSRWPCSPLPAQPRPGERDVRGGWAQRGARWLVCALTASACNAVAGIEQPSETLRIADAAPTVALPDAVRYDSREFDVRDAATDQPTAVRRRCDEVGDPLADADIPNLGVTFRSSAGAQSNLDSIDIAIPFVCQGDLLFLTLYADRYDATLTAPPGWTRQANRANATANFHAWWLYRFAVANEPLHNVFAFSRGVNSYGAVVAYTGVDANGAFYPGALVDLDKNAFVAPSIITAGDGLLVITAFVNDGWSGACSPEPPLIGRINYGALFVGDFNQASQGPTGTKSPGCSNAGPGAVEVIPLIPSGRCCY